MITADVNYLRSYSCLHRSLKESSEVVFGFERIYAAEKIWKTVVISGLQQHAELSQCGPSGKSTAHVLSAEKQSSHRKPLKHKAEGVKEGVCGFIMFRRLCLHIETFTFGFKGVTKEQKKEET